MSEKASERLLNQKKNGYDRISPQERQEMIDYCEEYKRFLAVGCTERECVEEILRMARERGYREFKRGDSIQPGDKLFRVEGKKSVILAVIGNQPMEQGAVICGAHIDNPRLDLKPNPLYEDSGSVARFKTHYYGGIRKYQWVSIPLALHGVVYRSNGEAVQVRIGDEPGDPQLTIPDLLPHLADKQAKEPLWQAIKGEDLNVLVGSEPYADQEEKERIKLQVMELLNEKYGITEYDFNTAELCVVPAFRPTDIGLDRSMVGAYGQDDRVCAFASLKALFDAKGTLNRTGICLLTDKEEIGSFGITGMDSSYFDRFFEDLCRADGSDYLTCIENSLCLSCDVTAAYDDNFAFAYDKYNAGRWNGGVGVCKYTGSRGKSGASDASAELLSYARQVLDADGVIWHVCELGKVDEGGGGTIAHYMARRGLPTLDMGTPLLAMHAPFEVSAKLDCYMTYRAARAFYQS